MGAAGERSGAVVARLVLAACIALAVTSVLLAIALRSGDKRFAMGAAGIAALFAGALATYSVVSSRSTRDAAPRARSLVEMAFGRAGTPRRRAIVSMALATAAALVVVYALLTIYARTGRVGFAILAAALAWAVALALALRFPAPPVWLAGDPMGALSRGYVATCPSCEKLNEFEAARCLRCGASMDPA